MLRVAAVVEQNWHEVPGGTAVSVNASLAALNELESELDLIGVAARHSAPPQAPFVAPVPVVHHRLGRRALYASWLMARKPKVQSITGPVDVIHATTAAIPPKSAPLVATVHDLAFLHFPDHASRAGQRFFLRSLALIKAQADLVLCPSQTTADDCIANGIESSRVRVAPWGVEVPPITELQRTEVRTRLGLPSEFVLFVGTVEPRKNLRRLVAAMESLDGVPLVVAGPAGWDDSIAKITAPLGDRAHCVGFLSGTDLHTLYCASTVFAWPSLFEGFGLPVLEAMAHGAAVVTSSNTSAAEVLGDAGVLVDPESTEEIAAAIDGLWRSPDTRADLAARATERAGTFTWARNAELTLDAYREVAR